MKNHFNVYVKLSCLSLYSSTAPWNISKKVKCSNKCWLILGSFIQPSSFTTWRYDISKPYFTQTECRFSQYLKCQYILSKKSWHLITWRKRIWIWNSPWKIYRSRIDEFYSLVYGTIDLWYIRTLLLPLLLILRKLMEV